MGERLRVFVVAGEPSGDQLGARLMQGLRAARDGPVDFEGVGGPAMAAAGLTSLFPMADIAVMGIGPVLARLPSILERIARTAAAAIAASPDVVVLIDSPDFTHRVAHRIRHRLPDVAIVVYVSPTVWMWRSGRAKQLAGFADALLAILPFEPEVHRILGGPPTTYVGHPVLERLDALRPPGGRADPAARPPGAPLRLLVLPGSRRSEIVRLMPVFGAALARLAAKIGPVAPVLPAVDHLRGAIEAAAAGWPIRPQIVSGEAAKFEAFRSAEVALAASGTVTLELAMAGVPMAVAYRLDWLGRRMKPLIRVPDALTGVIRVRSAVLPNLIAGEAAIPEYIDEAAEPEALAAALVELATGGSARERQRLAFSEVERRMRLPDARDPGEAAAAAVLQAIADKREGPDKRKGADGALP